MQNCENPKILHSWKKLAQTASPASPTFSSCANFWDFHTICCTILHNFVVFLSICAKFCTFMRIFARIFCANISSSKIVSVLFFTLFPTLCGWRGGKPDIVAVVLSTFYVLIYLCLSTFGDFSFLNFFAPIDSMLLFKLNFFTILTLLSCWWAALSARREPNSISKLDLPYWRGGGREWLVVFF